MSVVAAAVAIVEVCAEVCMVVGDLTAHVADSTSLTITIMVALMNVVVAEVVVGEVSTHEAAWTEVAIMAAGVAAATMAAWMVDVVVATIAEVEVTTILEADT